MSKSDRSDFRITDVDRALVDMIRVGIGGDGAGVRQLAQRLLRREPSELDSRDELRQALSLVVAQTPSPVRPFRAAEATVLELPDVRRTPRRRAGSSSYAHFDDHVEPIREQPTTNEEHKGRGRSGDSEAVPIALDVEQPNSIAVPVLVPPTQLALRQLVAERTNPQFAEHELEPTHRVLITGPPGVGKTLTAKYLAHELQLPLASLSLSTLMSSHLGESARNLRDAFLWTNRTPCLFFLDEFDAVGSARGTPDDVGEARRLVNVLLLELERWRGDGLLVAATNHPELLDRAALRRFELHLDLELPGIDERRRLIKELLSPHHACLGTDIAPMVNFAAAVTEGMSGSDLAQLLLATRRQALTADTTLLAPMIQNLSARPLGRGRLRDQLCFQLKNELALSQREVGNLVGMSHVAVGKAITRHVERRTPPRKAPTPRIRSDQ